MTATLATLITFAQAVVPRQAGHWSHVIGGWGAVIVIIGLYAVLLLRRGRKLSNRLKPEDRRWIE